MGKPYNKDELFDFVNDEKTDIDFNNLYSSVIDEDIEIRKLVAELLSRDGTNNGENALIDLLNDEDELVRAEACDSLCYYSGDKVLDALVGSLKNDQSEIVRSYALLSYWDVCRNDNKTLQKESMAPVLSELFEFEKSIQVKLNYAGLLYLCGNVDMLDYLLQELNNSDNHIRNTVMNNLVKISNEDNISYIQSKLKLFFNNESAGYVKKKMEAFLSYTSDMLDILKNK
jgi:HEAT repeat protein